MAVSVFKDGTQACSAATEHTLTANPETTAGAYQLELDLNPLTAGATLHIRIKEKVLSGGTQRVVWFDDEVGVVGEQKIYVSPVIMLVQGWDMSITCSAGSISIPWSIRKA